MKKLIALTLTMMISLAVNANQAIVGQTGPQTFLTKDSTLVHFRVTSNSENLQFINVYKIQASAAELAGAEDLEMDIEILISEGSLQPVSVHRLEETQDAQEVIDGIVEMLEGASTKKPLNINVSLAVTKAIELTK